MYSKCVSSGAPLPDDRTALLLSDFFDNAAVGLHWQDVRGIVQRVNRAELELLGYQPAEYVGRHISDFHVDPKLAGEIVERLAAGQTLHNFEATLRCKDDSVRHVLFSANGLWEDGVFIYARCFTRDITAQKLAQQAHVEADRRKTAILNASLDAIITMNAEGLLVDFNPAAERTFGYSRDFALGRRLADLIIPPELRQAHADGLQRYLRTGEGPVLGKRIEIGAMHASGRQFLVELSIQAVEGVTPVLFTATLRDITQRKADDQQLRQVLEERRELLESEQAARKEAERLSAMKDQFLAMLSHELRSPLSAILGWTQILKLRGATDPAQLAKGIDTIERNASQQARLIEELLDSSRIASGKLSLDLQLLDLNAVVTTVVESLQPQANTDTVALAMRLTPNALPVAGDATRLQQVVWNLASNALKFTPAGGRVEVATRSQDGHAVLEVRDTGSGIDPAFLPQVFDMFRQADGSSTRRHGGLGLGLAIVKRLVELHGGQIEASSPGVGCGATLTVQFPLHAEAPTPEAAIASQRDEHSCAPDLNGLRLLVVDDQPDAREMLAVLLQRCGANVRTAGSAGDAMVALRQEVPDAILSDIGMPEVDGYALIRQIRECKDRQISSVPAIALTAFASEQDKRRCLDQGFEAHLPKPLDLGYLATCLRAIVKPPRRANAVPDLERPRK